uniref:BTB domain-containing protein n=1 Tax=Panagrellus redivivus TaxID=6233 RepID=A0A7E4VZ41_PANRE
MQFEIIDNRQTAATMSKVQDTSLLTQFANLLLNESYSDVVFHIGGDNLPAHKVVLAQRSPVFNAMFLQEDDETKKRSITLTEPSLEAFKLFLQFVYTGVIDFEPLEIDIVLGVFQLAITYQMSQLEGLTVNHLDSIVNAQNVCDILNGAIKFEQETLIAHCLEQVKSDFSKILNSENFKKLSTKAVKHVLKDVALHVPDLITFRAFVEWMKANPSESTHFPELLKHIKLDSIALFELINAVRPSKLIDANDFMDIVYQQSIASTPICKKQFDYPDGNVLTPKNDVRVISGGASAFFINPTGTLKHRIGSYENITIDLKRRYILNSFVMKLAPGDKSYYIDVSTDYEHWIRIIDYSKYTCRSTQKLHFNDRAVRYLRISGTAPTNGIFEIMRLEASYTEKNCVFPFRAE